MNTLAIEQTPRADKVSFNDDELIVSLLDGRTIVVPLAWFPRLVNANAGERAQYELLGNGAGIHWPQIDEDISVLGLLLGRASIEHNPKTAK